eukprot:CAMPEP_0172634070 /NCGR_PEP_ID=MMETSP1068-20121228/192708_1 /TAXON_ID=35684 /ORGANISM="Pseudopedinella elastica, Strain CCMP716" /LENGTH=157 /DNA_ID=CAMNT_0013445931 /DNA_START=78 /DNA_END=551 /DNA_ORIENTATION=+
MALAPAGKPAGKSIEERFPNRLEHGRSWTNQQREQRLSEPMRRACAEAPSAAVAAQVKAFLEGGIDVDARNDFGETAMHFCAFSNNDMAARELIGFQARLDIRNMYGRTALDVATERERINVVALIEQTLKRRKAAKEAQERNARKAARAQKSGIGK